MGSLLDEIRAEDAAAGNRRIKTTEPEEAAGPSYPKLTGIEEFQRIFMEEVRRDDVQVRMPDDDTIARMRGSGWKRPKAGSTGPIGVNDWSERDPGVDCHRWYIERIAIPLEAITALHVIQARDMTHRILSPRFGGTFHHTLMTLQANTQNGQWAPVEIAFNRTVKPFLDGQAPTPFKGPQAEQGSEVVLVDSDYTGPTNGIAVLNGWTRAVNVNREVMEIIIRWADIRNAPHARVDMNGQIIADMKVSVQAPAAPAVDMTPLAELVREMAEANRVARAATEVRGLPPEPTPEATPEKGPKWAPKKREGE